MKATRKLIPAIAMLLISAVMMSTATFAWFSTNSTVTAKGLHIQATAKNTFLVIAETADGLKDTVSDGKTTLYQETEVDYKMTTPTTLYPVTYFKTADDTKTLKNGRTVEADSWYIAIADKTNASAAKAGTYVEVDEGDLVTGKYAIHKELYVRVATNFTDATNLRIAGVTLGNNAGTVVVKSSTATAVCKNGQVDATTLATDVSQTAIKLDLYFFIDGEHTSVYSENATNLDNVTLTIVFEVDAGT